MGKSEEKKFKEDFIKQCGKKKTGIMGWVAKKVTGLTKEEGCEKAADKAWENFEKNGPEKKGKKGILGKIKLKW